MMKKELHGNSGVEIFNENFIWGAQEQIYESRRNN